MSEPAPSPTSRIRGHHDVVVVGGGPAGTTTANYLARAGHDVLVLEREHHPRLSVGESLLPATTRVWQDLGILERMDELFVRKYGAYFDFGDCVDPEYYHFPDAAGKVADYAYEVERGAFDAMLWDAASEQGATCVSGIEVREFLREGDAITGVRIVDEAGVERDVTSRLVADCTGRKALLGSQLGIRVPDAKLNKVALFSHYDGAIRSTGADEGTLCILATDWGWVWLIPFQGDSCSVGVVVANDVFAKRVKGIGPARLFEALVEETRGLRTRLHGATRRGDVHTHANFSFQCRAYAGDGWVLVGDAAAFADPVFSSGVHLAMTGARRAADDAVRALAKGSDRRPRRRDFRAYERSQRTALKVFTKFIHAWYDPSFRRVFMRIPRGRPGVEFLYRRILAVLAGDVYRPWIALPPIQVLLWIAAAQRRADRRGVQGPSRPSLPGPA